MTEVVNIDDVQLVHMLIPKNVKISISTGIILKNNKGEDVLIKEFICDGKRIIPYNNTKVTMSFKISLDDCNKMVQMKDVFICKESGLMCELARGNSCKYQGKDMLLNKCLQFVDS